MTEENLPAKIDKAFIKASEFYGDELVPIRAAISSIPMIGGGIDMILASEGHRAFKERTEKLISAMRLRMESVREEAVSKDYLDSEEFIDLVVKALDATIKTRDEEKIQWYARILTESTMWTKQEGYSPEEYLYLIADLTPREVRMARFAYEVRPPRNGEEEWEEWTNQACAEVGVDKAHLSMILSRISSTGLIELVSSGVDENGYLWIHEGKLGEPGYYRVAPSFEKMMEFLELRT